MRPGLAGTAQHYSSDGSLYSLLARRRHHHHHLLCHTTTTTTTTTTSKPPGASPFSSHSLPFPPPPSDPSSRLFFLFFLVFCLTCPLTFELVPWVPPWHTHHLVANCLHLPFPSAPWSLRAPGMSQRAGTDCDKVFRFFCDRQKNAEQESFIDVYGRMF